MILSTKYEEYMEEMDFGGSDLKAREEMAYRLLSTLPRARLAGIQRRIAPLLQFDLVGSLPPELALQIFAHLPATALLTCARVCTRWRALADDPGLWKRLCAARGWYWRRAWPALNSLEWDSDGRLKPRGGLWGGGEDEGMGEEEGMLQEEEEEGDEEMHMEEVEDSGFASMGVDVETGSTAPWLSMAALFDPTPSTSPLGKRHSAPSILPSLSTTSTTYSLQSPLTPRSPLYLAYPPKANYKLLYQTHIRLAHRIRASSFRPSFLQARSIPSPTSPIFSPIPVPHANGHTNTIYCLQLYTYPTTGVQVLFTGSKDRTIREWDLGPMGRESAGVKRVLGGVHESSVLSVCVGDGPSQARGSASSAYVVSGGSDRRVVVWELSMDGEAERERLVGVLSDHEDSVLCVRFDSERLVTCSKDRTVRTYAFPSLEPQFVLGAHRAAVNAVSLSGNLIVSGSGDRSVRLWDARTGGLVRCFEEHHSRGIASIDFSPPLLVSGSSDKHLRVFDATTGQGWTTVPDVHAAGPAVCHACGATPGAAGDVDMAEACVHTDLVRSVALGEEFVVSGSYDLTIKVWERTTGRLVTDLVGGHTGRIFCIAFDGTKIVSCGEDQRICVWDFSHGIDTSFIRL
ncbi:WD40 repeat-like protein [Athelia psychrophila]|uniref:WD40 repeat-like protein n=1 Tax=Athelia psychrophila TaxID=1759441 RepID=A0A165XN14_9AGAM|nr:WD40 repeat-like protein [Fibularhizoctonia sp. CBS 109695]